MTDQPTYKKALEAMKEAEKVGLPVKSLRIRGREFELLFYESDEQDEYDMIDMKR